VKTQSSIKLFFTPKIASHAATEVLTKKGWMVIDSNHPWLALDVNNNPISIKKIKQSFDNSVYIDWKRTPYNNVFLESFVFVYGLYSRHGRFYPPYNFIPDINYGEFIQNAI
jgi:hypothetical protein